MKFSIVFSTVLALTMLAWASSFWLAAQPILNSHQADLLSKTTDMWQLGIGAIFGLLTEKLSAS
jgi:predicted metal-binding membrane protein